MENQATPRRDGQRIDLRLRVRYAAAEAQGEAEASDVSPHGLRLESDQPIPMGTRLKLQVDAGDGPPSNLAAQVMWCRAHQTPTGKTVHDVGLHLESAWLTPDMGRLGAALSRLFALQARETAPSYTRAPATLGDGGALRLVDLRVGLMHFHSEMPLKGRLDSGDAVTVHVDAENSVHPVQGRVLWVADQAPADDGARFSDAFVVDIGQASPPQKSLLERIRVGQSEPRSFNVQR
jgi:hypothetical protein